MSSRSRVGDPVHVDPLLNQTLQRRQQQGERRTQLVAHVGEESTFDSVQLNELLIRFFQCSSGFGQLEARHELAKVQLIVEIVPGHNDNSGKAPGNR